MVEPYTFYTRPSKKYRKIYYVRFRDPETGERLPGISTKTNKQVEAYRFAEDYLKYGLVASKANQRIYGPLKKIITYAYKEGDIAEDFSAKEIKVSKTHQKSKPFPNVVLTITSL